LVELTSQEIVTLHLEITQREDRIRELNKELGSRYKYDSMIGKSKPMQSLVLPLGQNPRRRFDSASTG
jgi:two-component system response regulator HupR/HoxA